MLQPSLQLTLLQHTVLVRSLDAQYTHNYIWIHVTYVVYFHV